MKAPILLLKKKNLKLSHNTVQSQLWITALDQLIASMYACNANASKQKHCK